MTNKNVLKYYGPMILAHISTVQCHFAFCRAKHYQFERRSGANNMKVLVQMITWT